MVRMGGCCTNISRDITLKAETRLLHHTIHPPHQLHLVFGFRSHFINIYRGLGFGSPTRPRLAYNPSGPKRGRCRARGSSPQDDNNAVDCGTSEPPSMLSIRA